MAKTFKKTINWAINRLIGASLGKTSWQHCNTSILRNTRRHFFTEKYTLKRLRLQTIRLQGIRGRMQFPTRSQIDLRDRGGRLVAFQAGSFCFLPLSQAEICRLTMTLSPARQELLKEIHFSVSPPALPRVKWRVADVGIICQPLVA
jgi:hypothetical protein